MTKSFVLMYSAQDSKSTEIQIVYSALSQELIKCAREHATPILPNKMAKSKYGRHDYLSVTFVDVITSDTPIIIDNNVIA